MSADSNFSIRTAAISDARAVRMLLPNEAEALSYCLVAEAGNPPRIVGAAGVTSAIRPKPLAGPGVAVHVVPLNRRQGIARSLVEKIGQQAGAAALYATQKVDLDSEEMRAWSALGFVPCETVQYHELPLEEFEIQLAPLLQRMHERGRIPPGARIAPLCEADLDAIAQLHLAVLGGDVNDLQQKLRGDVPDSYSALYSRILLIDDHVVGFILAHRAAEDVARVDANVLAPKVRGGWANVWLKLEATRGAQQLGIKKFVFTSFDHYTDTRSFAGRMQGITVATKVLMYRPLSVT
jgi:GNAT superfamily N-acetyltransferase